MPPTAGFSSSTSGLTASFTDSSGDSDGSIASRRWNFGDGGSSTATNPSHAYAAGGTYSVTLTVTDNEGATDTETKSVTVSDGGGGGDGVLANGVPETGIGGVSKSNHYFTLEVPSGASNLKFVTSGGSGDADLYVKLGSQPTTSSYDCASTSPTTTETCDIATAQAGTYHVLVHAWSAISGVSLTGSFDTGGGGDEETYTNGNNYSIRDFYYTDSLVAVSGRSGNAPADAQVTVDIEHTAIADLKVELIAPDGTSYVLHNRTGGSTDDIHATYTVNLSNESLNGTWRLRVGDYDWFDTGYIDSWSVTF